MKKGLPYMGEDYLTWMKRAESALALGLVAKSDEILFEDLCFQLQQAIEKAMKALLVYNDTEPPITHSFAVLAMSWIRSNIG